MSTNVQESNKQREVQLFWLNIASAVALVAGAAIALLGGSSAKATATTSGGGVTVSIQTGLKPDLNFSKDLRTAIMEAWVKIKPELNSIFTGGNSKVPFDTSLLRSTFNAILSPHKD